MGPLYFSQAHLMLFSLRLSTRHTEIQGLTSSISHGPPPRPQATQCAARLLLPGCWKALLPGNVQYSATDGGDGRTMRGMQAAQMQETAIQQQHTYTRAHGLTEKGAVDHAEANVLQDLLQGKLIPMDNRAASHRKS
eukprot:573147-Pelagomonas_calceolata.AAC.2